MSDETYTMKIEGMTCAHCEQSVSVALEEVGARDVQADFRRGQATFRLIDQAGNTTRFVDAVSDAGYQPGSIIALNTTYEERSTREPNTVRAVGRGTGGHAKVEYDLAIVGSGGAGMAAAITAMGTGARVVMIERDTVGGTCVNIGCVPSKTLLRASEAYHQAAKHPFAGVPTLAGAVNMPALVAQKDDLVTWMRQEKYSGLIEDYGWELIRGHAHFVDERTIQVGDRHIQATSVLVATGAVPAVPSIPGLKEADYLMSTSALALTEIPTSLFVIGAGYIALELGQLFNRLGSQVTIMQRGQSLLEDHEPEIGELMRQVLTDQGIQVITGAYVERVEVSKDDQSKRVHLAVDGESRVYEATHILVATGRTPNTADLALQSAGVEVDGRGAIIVDVQLRTTNPHVWAAGDVTLGPQFVYVASYEGKLAAENALNNAKRTLDFTALPAVIFTTPQVAVVGLTKQQAQAQNLKVKNVVLPLDVVPRALVNYDTAGLVKMVAEEGSNRILGVHVVAENAGDVIYAATLVVKHGLTVHDLVDSFAPYLTMSESLKLAAQSFGRNVHKLSCCAA